MNPYFFVSCKEKMATDPDTGISYKRQRNGALHTGYFNKIGLPGVQSFRNGLEAETPWSREQITFDGDASQLFYPPDMFQIEDRIVYIKVKKDDGTYARRRVGYLDSENQLALVTQFATRADFMAADLQGYPKGAMAWVRDPDTFYIRDPDVDSAPDAADKVGWRRHGPNYNQGEVDGNIVSAIADRKQFQIDVSDYIDPSEMENIRAFQPQDTHRTPIETAFADVPENGVLFFPPGRYKFVQLVQFYGKSFTLLGPGAILDFTEETGGSKTHVNINGNTDADDESAKFDAQSLKMAEVLGGGNWRRTAIEIQTVDSWNSDTFDRGDQLLLQSDKPMVGEDPSNTEIMNPGTVVTIRQIDPANRKLYLDQAYLDDYTGWSDTAKHRVTVQKANGRSVSVVGLTFLGRYKSGGYDQGLQLSRLNDVTVTDCHFYSFIGSAIKINACANVIVSNCHFTGLVHELRPDGDDEFPNGFRGMFINGVRNMVINGNTAKRLRRFIDPSKGGISSGSLMATNNVIDNCIEGLGSHTGSENSVYDSNYITCCHTGIASRSMNNTYTNNTIRSCIVGMETVPGSGFSTRRGVDSLRHHGNFTIQNNHVSYVRYGIRVFDDHNSVVIQNNSIEALSHGIIFRACSLGPLCITGNSITSVPETGYDGSYAAYHPTMKRDIRPWDYPNTDVTFAIAEDVSGFATTGIWKLNKAGLAYYVLDGLIAHNSIRGFDIGLLDNGSEADSGPYNGYVPGGVRQAHQRDRPTLYLCDNHLLTARSFHLGWLSNEINGKTIPVGDDQNIYDDRAPFIGKYVIRGNVTRDLKHFRWIGYGEGQNAGRSCQFQSVPTFSDNYFGDNGFCEGMPQIPGEEPQSGNSTYPFDNKRFHYFFERGFKTTYVPTGSTQAGTSGILPRKRGMICESAGVSTGIGSSVNVGGNAGDRVLQLNDSFYILYPGWVVQVEKDGTYDYYIALEITDDHTTVHVDRDLERNYDINTEVLSLVRAKFREYGEFDFAADHTFTGNVDVQNTLSIGVPNTAKRYDDLPTTISNVQDDIDELETDVGNLQTDVGNLQTDVSNLENETYVKCVMVARVLADGSVDGTYGNYRVDTSSNTIGSWGLSRPSTGTYEFVQPANLQTDYGGSTKNYLPNILVRDTSASPTRTWTMEDFPATNTNGGSEGTGIRVKFYDSTGNQDLEDTDFDIKIMLMPLP